MQSRSERYNDKVTTNTRLSRAKKNAYLYDDINKKIGLEIVDFDDRPNMNFKSIISDKKEDFSSKVDLPSLEKEPEEKVYDINSVLEEAKKNRTEVDELEKKRNLKNEEYSVLSDLNKEYINNKDKKGAEVDEEELQELINTITSNTLAKEVKDKELFSDLMATSSDLKLDDTDKSNNEEIKVEKTEDGKLINSFYTKSMDLSEHDFDMSDEFVENNSKLKIFLVIFIILVILGILSVVAYFLLKWRNII